MKVSEAIDICNRLKRNQHTTEDKVRWLADLDEQIIEEIIKGHEGEEAYLEWTRYTTSQEDMNRELIVPDVYAEIYEYKLEMEIDRANGELNKYANDQIMYNSYLSEYRNWYNRNHIHHTTKIKGAW